MKCMTCGFENDYDAEYCEKCGSALLHFCPKCHSLLKPNASFCKKCGTPITPQPVPKEKAADSEKARSTGAPTEKEKKHFTPKEDGGERKPVTILFTDIVGSTSLAEKVDPEEWKEIVSGAHACVIRSVHRYGGTIAQLLGDGVLAFFGAPVTHEDDAIRAVRAALDIQQEIGRYAFELKGYMDDFQMRVGLNTGLVVVGNVGTEMHMEYLAIGDAVNIASRLQSAAQPGKILISESTARLVKTAFELSSIGEIIVKGKAEPLNAYEVMARKGAIESMRGFDELQSPLVGRENEQAILMHALTDLCNGHGQIVAVLGEAGIGKSRLVEEAYCSSSDLRCQGKPPGQESLNWIEGRALSYGATLSFWTISQLIKNDLGLSDADPEPRIRVALCRRVDDLFGDQADQNLPYLGRLLGVKLDGKVEDQLNILDSESLKRQTLICITRYFEKLANVRPTVAVFEDLHWIDPSSLEALELLLSVTDRAPLMLLLLSRLEREHPSWRIKLRAETDFSHRYTEIQLKPLSAGQQSQLVDNLLRIAELPEDLRNLILERSEGIPFYLEEIVRSLIEQGAIRREGEHWIATQDFLKVTVPDTLQGVLLARLDRLQEDVRRTLQLASVIGRSFLYSILDAISEAEQKLDEHLVQLQRVDLVREKARIPELEYIFKHSLTQEAAYSSLLVARRVEFHRKVGEALEKLFPERLEEFYGLLAHHFEAAGENRKAAEYLIRAGDKSRLMAELTEAIGYFQRSIPILERLGDTDRMAQVWFKLGLIYMTNFQFDEAHAAHEKAFGLQKQLLHSKPENMAMKSALLRYGMPGAIVSLDPGNVDWQPDYQIISNLFAGLVQLDDEQNVVPDVARSWQVLDGGCRYLFYLRDDVRWSDGSSVTATDFEYAWKRNLHPDFSPDTETADALFPVVGAQAFHEGRNQNPDLVGVHAIDDFTLEVCLQKPVAYFPFMLSTVVTYPLHRQTIERFGEEWWQPGKMVSNGPFQLTDYDPKLGYILVRNPYYYGEFLGNVQRIELTLGKDIPYTGSLYQHSSIDIAYQAQQDIYPDITANEKHFYYQPGINFLLFHPEMAPLGDVRIRKALALALDRNELFRRTGTECASGGIIPPGIPGHSPDISFHYDPVTARSLFAEAGFPDGKGFPPLHGLTRHSIINLGEEIARQWKIILGIDAVFEPKTPYELATMKAERAQVHYIIIAWMFDYPDPDNLLCRPNAFLAVAHIWGWHDREYHDLVNEAARTSNLKHRMEMYRQADRILVQEQAVALPLSYGNKVVALAKPWIKNLKITPTGRVIFKDIVIEEH